MEAADDLVHADAGGLGLGHGDLLHGVLQFDARGFQFLDQVGPVQQLEGRGALAVQPFLKQAADALARMHGVEVGRAGAQRPLLHHIGFALGLFGDALGQDGDRVVLAGLRIQRLLGHPHRGEPAALEQFLGRLDRALAKLGGGFEIERRTAGTPREDFEMDAVVVHQRSVPRCEQIRACLR